MRNLNELNRYRRTTPDVIALFGNTGNALAGVFDIPITTHPSRSLKCLATSASNWDHISVSLPDRCPTWDEMSRVKDIFFYPNDDVMQLHPSAVNYINRHPFCLHLWRPLRVKIPLPPLSLV